MKHLHILVVVLIILFLTAFSLRYTSSISAIGTNLESFVTLLSPNGGETIRNKSFFPITWTNSSNIDRISLYYLLDNGTFPIALNIGNTNYYNWNVNINSGYTLPQVKILIMGAQTSGPVTITTVSDFSDNYFTVLPALTPTPTINPTVTPRPTCQPVICRPGIRCPMRPECIIETF